MPGLSLRQAAQQAAVSKSTILRALQSGRLSGTRTDDGGWSIDPAELHRVYPVRSAQRSGTDAPGQDAPAHEPAGTPGVAALETEVRMLREMLAKLEAAQADMREDRDRWRAMAEDQSRRFLSDHRPWWRRMAG